jgi:hypothetical protein
MTRAASVVLTWGAKVSLNGLPHLWEATVQFDQDALGLPVTEHPPTVPPSVCFAFGANRLWTDRVDTVTHAKVWLEVDASDVPAAARYLQAAGIVRRDLVAPLSEDHEGF